MKYEALTPIRHDGEFIAVGETFDLSEKEAKSLIDAGLIAKPKSAAEKAAAEKAAAEQAAAQDASAAPS